MIRSCPHHSTPSSWSTYKEQRSFQAIRMIQVYCYRIMKRVSLGPETRWGQRLFEGPHSAEWPHSTLTTARYLPVISHIALDVSQRNGAALKPCRLISFPVRLVELWPKSCTSPELRGAQVYQDRPHQPMVMMVPSQITKVHTRTHLNSHRVTRLAHRHHQTRPLSPTVSSGQRVCHNNAQLPVPCNHI